MDLQALKDAVPSDVLKLCQTLQRAGHRSWVVGGCVRDLLLASDAASASIRNDWDIATDALPEQVQKLFRKVIPTGIKHGTVTVMLGGVGYEVTTLRGETTYSDGRRPDEVYFVDDIRADLARRDFTVNAIAYDPLEEQLIDPFGGAQDLQHKLLRAVGVAKERFDEDGLRILRGARFVASLGMELEESTAAAMRPSLPTYRKVSPERIRDEWMKTLKTTKPSRGFQVMLDHGMLEVSVPELFSCADFASGHAELDGPIWQHLMQVLDACPPDPVLRTAALLHDVGEPRLQPTDDARQHAELGAQIADGVCARLRFSNAERERVVALVRNHVIDFQALRDAASLRRWMRRVDDCMPQLWELVRADLSATAPERLSLLHGLIYRTEQILQSGMVWSTRDLAIGGKDLMQELGLPPSKQLGVILEALLERVTDEPGLNQRDKLLELARGLVTDAG
ncbi:MAG: HD domain-containing protein [Polyangiaceae bacterium]